MNALHALRSCTALAAALLSSSACGAPVAHLMAVPHLEVAVELPLAGDDGAAGLSARNAIDLAFNTWRARSDAAVEPSARISDTSEHGFQNPHRDEGTDNSDQPQVARAILQRASGESMIAAIGGLRANVVNAEVPLARGAGLPLLTLAPLPVSCGASRLREPADVFSLAGSDRTEALAVARFAARSRSRALAVVDDGEKDRVRVADCLTGLLRANTGPRLAVRVEGARDRAGALRLRSLLTRSVAIAFVGPASAGTLLCGAAAARNQLTPRWIAALGHREYDSTDIEPGCGWVSREVRPDDPRGTAFSSFEAVFRRAYLESPSDDAVAAYATAQVIASALDAAVRSGALSAPHATRQTVVKILTSEHFETILGQRRFAPDGEPNRVWFVFKRRLPDGTMSNNEISLDS